MCVWIHLENCKWYCWNSKNSKESSFLFTKASLFGSHIFLRVAFCSLLSAPCLLVFCSFLVTFCSLSVSFFSLLVTFCLLFVTFCLLLVHDTLTFEEKQATIFFFSFYIFCNQRHLPRVNVSDQNEKAKH